MTKKLSKKQQDQLDQDQANSAAAISRACRPVPVELVESRTLIRQPCTVCGGCTERVRVVAEARNLDHELIVRVCEDCLRHDDIDGRLENTAFFMEANAKYVRGLKGRLVLPTYAQWEKRNDELEAEFVREQEKSVRDGDTSLPF